MELAIAFVFGSSTMFVLWFLLGYWLGYKSVHYTKYEERDDV